MKKTLGWIVEAPQNPLLDRPLLGRVSREHVRQAMEDGGVLVADDQAAFSTPYDLVLLVREDAPCLTPALLHSLMQAVGGGTATSGALLSAKREALAMVMPREKWFAAVQSYALSAREIAKMLLSGRDDKEGGQGHKATAPEACIAVDDGPSFCAAYGILRETIVSRHLAAGVLLLDPRRTIIEAQVTIAPGVTIYPDNVLMGQTAIAEGCVLYPNNRLQNARVGRDTTLESSVLLDCEVGGHNTVGPFAYLRPGTKVGDHCRIGDFVEVKNSSIGDHTKISHLTYVGDSDLGQNINLGCGVVFVNYDGKAKKRSIVEDNAFIGCNCNLVAPVTVGENAYIAAGSTVVENVPPDSLYVARSRATIKEGWVTRRKEEGKL